MGESNNKKQHELNGMPFILGLAFTGISVVELFYRNVLFPPLKAFLYDAFILPLMGMMCIKFARKWKGFHQSELVSDLTETAEGKLMAESALFFLPFMKYWRFWLVGFIVMTLWGIVAGYFFKSLNIVSMLLFFTSLGSIYLLIEFIHVVQLRSPENNQFLSILLKKRSSFGISQLRTRLIDGSHVLIVFLLVTLVLLIPRLPVLMLAGGVFGVDTWYASALASRMVLVGKIDFLSGIFGIFEILPTDKTVVAPLSLAMMGIFSGMSVLEIQFFHVFWMTLIGVFILSELIYHLAREILVTIRSESGITLRHSRVAFFSLILSSIFHVIPIVLSYTDGFLTGRTIFILFFPIMLFLMYELISKVETGKRIGKTLILMLFFAFFFSLAHRMSLVISLPILMIVFTWIAWRREMFSIIKLKTFFNHDIKGNSFATISIITFVVFIFANIVLVRILSRVQVLWIEAFYGTKYLPQLITRLLSSNKYMKGVFDGFFGLNVASGGLLFLFILVSFLAFSWRKGLEKKFQSMPRIKIFYQMLFVASWPGLFLIYVGAYFYQALLHVMFLIVLMSGLIFLRRFANQLDFLIYSQDRRQKDIVTPFHPEKKLTDVSTQSRISAKPRESFPRRLMVKNGISRRRAWSWLFIIIFFLVILSSGMVLEYLRVNRSFSASEWEKRYVSTELKLVAGFLDEQVLENEMLTVLVSHGSLSFKLSTLLPSIRFLPNHPTLYVSYGFVSYKQYVLRPFPLTLDVIDIFRWLKYPFDSSPYRQFEQELFNLLRDNITDEGVKNLLLLWDVKYILVSNEENNGNDTEGSTLLPFFVSVRNSFQPVFHTSHFELYELNLNLLTI